MTTTEYNKAKRLILKSLVRILPNNCDRESVANDVIVYLLHKRLPPGVSLDTYVTEHAGFVRMIAKRAAIDLMHKGGSIVLGIANRVCDRSIHTPGSYNPRTTYVDTSVDMEDFIGSLPSYDQAVIHDYLSGNNINQIAKSRGVSHLKIDRIVKRTAEKLL